MSLVEEHQKKFLRDDLPLESGETLSQGRATGNKSARFQPEAIEMYNIRCEVWGGVTGHRTSLLKSDGEVVNFETREEAQKEADRLNKQMNNAYSVASFRYSVEG